MKTVLWTVFIGGTLAGGSPNKKPATKSPGAERSEAHMPPLPWERGLGVRVEHGKGLGKTPQGLSPEVCRAKRGKTAVQTEKALCYAWIGKLGKP